MKKIDLKNKKIGVLYGGMSSEREVSLRSGEAIYKALINLGFNAKLYDVDSSFMNLLVNERPFDLAFIALHGRGGEDGTIQAVLEYLEMPYTGSGVLASALAMDKVKTKQIWQANGIPVLPQAVLSEGFDADKVIKKVGFPMAVKPALEGSSVGISKVCNKNELILAYKEAKKYNCIIMAEKWVDGAELTIAIVADEVMPVIKIDVTKGFYDYNTKYITGATSYNCPSGLDLELEDEVKLLAKKSADILGVSGWSRVDVMLDEDNSPWILEINTIPGMTEKSLVPKAAKQAGYSFDEVVLKIIEQVEV